MIEVRTQVPRVYYGESRDFQLLGRIYESIFNYVKTNVDNLENIMDVDDTDDRLVNLLATSVGFESKHTYNAHNLKIICGCFNDIIKYKGSRIAIDKAVAALLNSQGLDAGYSTEPDYDNKNINIFIPASTEDIILLKDLLDYILPVGWSYSISTSIGGIFSYETEAKTSDTFELVDKRGEVINTGVDTDELNKIAKLNDSNENIAPTSLGIIHTEPEE